MRKNEEKQIKQKGIAGDLDKYIGSRIKSLRILKGMTQADLGKILNVTIQQIQKYESGKNRTPVNNLLLMAEACGVKEDYFWRGYKRSGKIEKVVTVDETKLMQVSSNFAKIKSPEYRNAINVIVRGLSKVPAA